MTVRSRRGSVRAKLAVTALSVCYLLMASDTIAPLGKYTAAERRHWAFVPRSHPDIPVFREAADRAWGQTPLDALVLARLKKEELKPSPAADRSTLVRRVYFDLTGLPPTPAEVSAFVSD